MAESKPNPLPLASQSPARRLRDAGLRMTSQRKAVLEAALEATDHFSAEDLWYDLRRRGRTVSRATVYRFLTHMTDAGLLRELRLAEGHAHYEPVRSGDCHYHLVCLRCGRVIEFEGPGLESALAQACAEHGFEASRCALEVGGLCAECVAEGSGQEDAACPSDGWSEAPCAPASSEEDSV